MNIYFISPQGNAYKVQLGKSCWNRRALMHIQGENIFEYSTTIPCSPATQKRPPIDNSDPKRWPSSSEYKDALSGVLEDQARRTELRSGKGPSSGRPRLHPAIAPVLALVAVWLWVFPPAVLVPVVPSLPPADAEAGLRMEMFVQFTNVHRYLSEFGRLPTDLQEVGDSPEGVEYERLSGDIFQLSGETGNLRIEYRSTEPVESLLADAMAVVSRVAESTPQ